MFVRPGIDLLGAMSARKDEAMRVLRACMSGSRAQSLVIGGVPMGRQVRDLMLGRTRDDCPRAAGLDAALRETLEGKSGARSTVRFTELFDRLVRYRNTVLAHAAPGQLQDDFNERMAQALPTLPDVKRVWPSDANFILVECGDPTRALDRARAANLLIREVRAQFGLPRCVRISIGTPDQNERLLVALR